MGAGLEKYQQAAAVCEKSKAVTTEYTEHTEENLLGMERLGFIYTVPRVVMSSAGSLRGLTISGQCIPW